MKFYLYFLSVATLISCGGGGSSSGPSPAPLPTPSPSPAVNQIEHLAGGEATVALNNANAFSEHSKNLSGSDKIITFNLGNDFFENPWISGNASTSQRDGLGGFFNNNACQDCHIRDGRGHAPLANDGEQGTDFSSLLFRAARANVSDGAAQQMANSEIANVGDSAVGGQIQHDAIAGLQKEADLFVTYSNVSVQFNDGEIIELRKPEWHLISNYAADGYDFDVDTVFSARVAPQMIGLGLLALISELEIVNRADPEDTDGNGISGKANYVWSAENEDVRLGRFGWKAGQPSLLEQSAGAFLNDMGLTSRLHLTEACMSHQQDCIDAPQGDGDSQADYSYEVSDRVLDAIAFYSSHLAVPERQNAYDDDVQAGKQIFNDIGCADCHVAQYTTEFSEAFPELSEQIIFPYTDMLLHDMGDALADFTIDNRPADASVAVEFLANAREWRTPPLWGIGRAKTVDPEASFLHDGRALNLRDAVLWHGGEAEASKQAVLALSKLEREQLLAFLNDL